MNKKIISLTLGFFMLVPLVTFAQSVSTGKTVQEQIAALLQQIQSLQQQIAQLQSGGSGKWCHTFNTNLGVGSSGSEVDALNNALQKEELISGIEHSSNFQASFDERVAAAVTGFQEKYKDEILTPNGLRHGTGYVGKTTRAKLNNLYGCGETPPPIPTLGTLSIDPASATIKVGESVQVKAMFTDPVPECVNAGPVRCLPPIRAPYEVSAKFVSDNANVAEMNQAQTNCYPPPGGTNTCPSVMNFVRAISPGAATITATYIKDQQTFTARMRVTVVDSTPQPSITVVQPNGGDVWEIGSIKTIRWTSNNIPSDQKIDVIRLRDAYGTETNLLTGTINDGWEQITVPSVPPGTYRLEIKTYSINGELIFDSSDEPFSIVAADRPSITVVSPNGGQIFLIGFPVDISWRVSGLPSNTTYVHLQLSPRTDLGGTSVGDIDCTGAIFSPQNSFTWDGKTICGNGITTTVTPGSYKILATLYSWPNTNNPGIEIASDLSDALFSIVSSAQPKMQILAPNGGETLVKGKPVMTSWTGGYPKALDSNGVALQLVKPDGTQVGWISFGNPPSGSFSWDPAKVMSANGYGYNQDVDPGQYKIYAVDYNSTNWQGPRVNNTDMSDAAFSIVSPSLPISIFIGYQTARDVTINGGVQGATGPLTFSWGDGQKENGYFPLSHTYAQDGHYTITVFASNVFGQQGTQTIEVDAYQALRASLNNPTVSGSTITVNGAIVYDPGSISKITWNWGDGDTKAEDAQWFPASHVYTRMGTYLIRLTGWTNDGKKIITTKYWLL